MFVATAAIDRNFSNATIISTDIDEVELLNRNFQLAIDILQSIDVKKDAKKQTRMMVPVGKYAKPQSQLPEIFLFTAPTIRNGNAVLDAEMFWYFWSVSR